MNLNNKAHFHLPISNVRNSLKDRYLRKIIVKRNIFLRIVNKNFSAIYISKFNLIKYGVD